MYLPLADCNIKGDEVMRTFFNPSLHFPMPTVKRLRHQAGVSPNPPTSKMRRKTLKTGPWEEENSASVAVQNTKPLLTDSVEGDTTGVDLTPAPEEHATLVGAVIPATDAPVSQSESVFDDVVG